MRFEGKLKVDGLEEAGAIASDPQIVAREMMHYFQQYYEDFTNYDFNKKIVLEIRKVGK